MLTPDPTQVPTLYTFNAMHKKYSPGRQGFILYCLLIRIEPRRVLPKILDPAHRLYTLCQKKKPPCFRKTAFVAAPETLCPLPYRTVATSALQVLSTKNNRSPVCEHHVVVVLYIFAIFRDARKAPQDRVGEGYHQKHRENNHCSDYRTEEPEFEGYFHTSVLQHLAAGDSAAETPHVTNVEPCVLDCSQDHLASSFTSVLAE